MDEMLRRTGFQNAAADYGLTQTGDLPLERLIAKPPDVPWLGSSDLARRTGLIGSCAIQPSPA